MLIFTHRLIFFGMFKVQNVMGPKVRMANSTLVPIGVPLSALAF